MNQFKTNKQKTPKGIIHEAIVKLGMHNYKYYLYCLPDIDIFSKNAIYIKKSYRQTAN